MVKLAETLPHTCMLQFQISTCAAIRRVQYSLDFPDPSCPPTNTPPGEIRVRVETGSTVFDAMVAAADRNRDYNFQTTYFGDSGFFIDAINGTASQNPCFWFFYYVIPGLSEQKSQFGVSNVVVPGDNFSIILRYMDFNNA